MAPRWPRVNNGPEHINEHATYLKEACQQLQAVDKGRQNQVPWNIVQPYLESTIALVGKVLRQPALREILQQVKDAAQCTQKIQSDVTIIMNSVGVSSSPLNASNFSRGRPAASWAQVAAQAKGSPPLPPPVPQAPTSKTHSTVTAYKDRVVTVKLKDQGAAQLHRAHSAAWTKRQVETSVSSHAATRPIKIVAAHQLKSGDIQIFTSTTAEAAQLKQNKEWLGGLGARAELIVPTYGVIVHGIPTNSINIKDQNATIDRVLADNRTVIPEAKISYVGWLTKEGNLKRASSIVVEFTDPMMANAVIYAGMAWDGVIHQCQLYDRACRMKQCFRCYHYGHITTQCNASQICGYCAELHETKDCRRKAVEGFTPRCAVCKENHTAWSNACPARRKEMKRVEQAKEVRSIYWHVPRKESPKHVDIQSPRRVVTRPEDTSTGPLVATHASERVPTRAEPERGHSEASLSQHIELPAGSPGVFETTTLQILVTPPAGDMTEVAEQLPEPTPEHVEAAEYPIHLPDREEVREPTIYPDLGLHGVLQQEADDWLANLADGHDNDWLGAMPEIPEPSPLTSNATDTRAAEGRLYKGCRCREHQDIYTHWPTRDAELTIAKCMRVCVYCGEDYTTAAALRGHMRRLYERRNLTICLESRGRWSAATPSWTPKLDLVTRRSRSRPSTEGITTELSL